LAHNDFIAATLVNSWLSIYGHSFISQNACYSRYVWLTADTVFDRNLPLSLNFNLLVKQWLALLFGNKDAFDMVYHVIPKWIRHSGQASRLWLKQQIYGYRWFGVGKKYQGHIIVVRNLDVTKAPHRKELRTLMELCPDNAGCC